MKFCPECGAKFAGTKFCPECGANLSSYLDSTDNNENTNDSFDFSILNEAVEKENKIRKEIYDNFCKNAVIENGVLKKYNGKETEITIPVEITVIADAAFSSCIPVNKFIVDENHPTLTAVDGNLYSKDMTIFMKYANGKTESDFELPNGVTTIHSYAFANSYNLKTVKLAETVSTVGEGIFWVCTALTYVALSPLMKKIEKNTFNGCSSLDISSIPYSIEVIGETAFAGCSSIPYINISKFIKSIEKAAFSSCKKLRRIYFEDGITSIGELAFSQCGSLEDVTLPNTITSLGKYAFYCCSGLTKAIISNKMTKVEDCTFASCTNLIEVFIPSSVKELGGYAFNNCKNLRFVRIDNIDSWLQLKINGPQANPLYGNSSSLYIDWSYSSIREIVIPGYIKKISDSLFWGYEDLYSIKIEDGVTEIGNCAFYDCKGLRTISIPNSVTTIGGCVFTNCQNLTSIKLPRNLRKIENGLFDGCSRLSTVIVPCNVESIASNAFLRSGVTWLFVPRGRNFNVNNIQRCIEYSPSDMDYDGNLDIRKYL